MHRRDDADRFAVLAKRQRAGAMFCGERSSRNSIRTLTSRSWTRSAAAAERLGEVPVEGARRLVQQEAEAVLGRFAATRLWIAPSP